VVVDKSGLKSCDYYYSLERAQDRAIKLLGKYEPKQIVIQHREVTEWEDVT
jgi:hypothetical protein